MNLYKKIKKEHLFVFLVIFTALVIFNYFSEFNYTGLVVKDNCYDKGYNCCISGEGRGVNHFSLDDTCNGKTCWDTCQIKETKNLITGNVGFIDSVIDWFKGLFKRENVGELVSGVNCLSDKPNKLFTVSDMNGEGHASIYLTGLNSYGNSVCSSKVRLNTTSGNGIPLINLSESTNAHVEKIGLNPQNYNVLIKVISSSNPSETVSVEYIEDTSLPYCNPLNEECLFSISGDTSAHVGPCIGLGSFDTKVCVSVGELDNSPKLLTVSKIGSGNGTVTSSPSGINCGTTCSASLSGTVTLTAVSNATSTFNGWSGEGCLGTGTCQVTMSQARTVTATFTNNFGVPPVAICNNGSIDPGEQCETNNLRGYTCINYTQGSQFTGGTLACSVDCLSFNTTGCTPNSNLKTLTISPVPTQGKITGSGINCGAGITGAIFCSKPFSPNAQVSLNAIPISGYTFSHWEITGVGTSCLQSPMYNNCNLTMDANKSVNAAFFASASNLKTLTIQKIGTGLGTVTSTSNTTQTNQINCGSTCSASYPLNTIVNLTAIPSLGSIFSWVNCNNYIGNNCTVTMNSAKTVIANFTNPLCGNSFMNLFEDCDGTDLNEKTCQTLNSQYNGGNLACYSNCTFNVSGCYTIPLVENCANGIDDDGDGIIDGFDLNCMDSLDSTPYPYYVSFNNMEISNATNYTYSNQEVDIKCGFIIQNANGITLNDASLRDNAYPCIKATINDVECTNKQNMGYTVRFYDCNVGSAGTKVISCKKDTDCHASGTRPYIDVNMDVRNYEYCEYGVNAWDISLDNVEIEEYEYETGDLVEMNVSVTNFDTNDDDLTVVASAVLFDINNGEEVVLSSPIEKLIPFDTQGIFLISFAVPSSIDEDHDYFVYVKAYEKNNEDDNCIEESFNVELNEGEGVLPPCTCVNNTQCNSDYVCDSTANCDEGNGKTGLCIFSNVTICTNGATLACSTGLQGICSEGVKTCANNIWGNCIQTQTQLAVDVCGDGLDNDCDRASDCSDSDCSGLTLCRNVPQPEGLTPSEDEDGDGLRDSWELEYFGNLALVNTANGDYDNDGVSNAQEYLDGTDPKDPNDYLKAPSYWWVWLVGIIILIIIIYFVFSKMSKPKKKSFDNIPNYSRQMNTGDNKLKNYVKSSLLKGYNKEQIKRALKSKGWKEEDIEDAFR